MTSSISGRIRPDRGVETMSPGEELVALSPGPDRESIARGVARWKFAGHGERPIDHIGRDLLFGSLARDYRAWPYHEFREEVPPWAAPALDPVESAGSSTHRSTLTNHILLRLVHDLSLARLVEEGRGRITRGQLDTIEALYTCRPVGLAMEWHEQGRRPYAPMCWLNRLCPWCHCRKVVRLYQRLLAGPCDPLRARNKILVMAKVRVRDEGEPSEILTPERVSQVLGRWKPALGQYGRRLGMVGGLIGHQVGPFKFAGPGGMRSFEHVVSVLAEVPCEVGGEWSREGFDRLAVRAGFQNGPDAQPLFEDAASGECRPVEVTAMPMESTMALRWLLAGSAGHPMWGEGSQITIERNRNARMHEGNPAVRKGIGVDGALALQPSFLFTFDQLFSFHAAIAGRHLFATFGTWKGVSAGSEGDVVRRQARGPSPGWALKGLNAGRREAAALTLGHLMPLAGRVFDELKIALGRSPGRSLLERGMAENGLAVSRRQAVALIKALGDRSVVG